MREKEKSTRLLFMRHGATDFPIDRIYCDDREDPALNELGRRQARSVLPLLDGEEIAAIYASPARRTMETAQPTADQKMLPIRPVPALMERRFGIWEGLYFHEIEQGYPEDYRRWKRDNAGFRPEGGESIPDMLTRLSGVLQEIITEHHGQSVLVVTHVGPIRALTAHAIGLPIDHFRRLTIDNGSLTRIDFGRSQNNLRYLNRIGFAADI